MSRTYNVIDADGHVLEPPNFWADYIDPACRDRVPQLSKKFSGQRIIPILTDFSPVLRR
jgi:hypothetical protein